MTVEIAPEHRRRIRNAFPALAGDTVFLENAGGSQVPALIADWVLLHGRRHADLGPVHGLVGGLGWRGGDAAVAAVHGWQRDPPGLVG
jgi:hypothetical protein